MTNAIKNEIIVAALIEQEAESVLEKLEEAGAIHNLYFDDERVIFEHNNQPYKIFGYANALNYIKNDLHVVVPDSFYVKKQEEIQDNQDKYHLKNIYTGEIVALSLDEILEEINRDRSDEWTKYDKTDWKEGLEEFTEYEYIKQINKEEYEKINLKALSLSDIPIHESLKTPEGLKQAREELNEKMELSDKSQDYK